MLAIPIPLIVCFALVFMLIHAVMKGQLAKPFLVLIGMCALQSLIVALTQYYSVDALRLVQPATAAIIAPLTFVVFQATAIRNFSFSQAAPHVLPPLFVAFCVVFVPSRNTVDFALMAIFAFYDPILNTF